jgi:hypothetical protein
MDVGNMDLFLRPIKREKLVVIVEAITFRIMQWNFSPTMEIGQYVCLLVDIADVSSNGTHFA